jgi:hypothetical protein
MKLWRLRGQYVEFAESKSLSWCGGEKHSTNYYELWTWRQSIETRSGLLQILAVVGGRRSFRPSAPEKGCEECPLWEPDWTKIDGA